MKSKYFYLATIIVVVSFFAILPAFSYTSAEESETEQLTFQVNIEAVPMSVDKGSSTKLVWNSQNMDECTGDNFETGGAVSGTTTIKDINEDTIFTIFCENKDGETFSDNVLVEIKEVESEEITEEEITEETTEESIKINSLSEEILENSEEDPLIFEINLSANPTVIDKGSSTELVWNSQNMDECTGDNFETGGAVSGTTTIKEINEDTIFTIFCENKDGEIFFDDVLIEIKEVETSVLEAEMISLNSSNFPFIYLNTRVFQDGTPLAGLSQDDFLCTEDGQIQTDSFFVTPPEIGDGVRLVDFVFLIDVSGSMGNAINGVRDNVISFTDALDSSNINYRLGLVQFGQSADRGNPILLNNGLLTADAELFQGLVANLRVGGWREPGFLALRTAVREFDFRHGAQKVFILITDEDSDDPDKQGAIDLLLANDVVVHVAARCSFGRSQDHYCNETSVRGVTGGLLFDVQGPYDDVLDTIATLAGSAYVLRYKSSNPTYDGTERVVECTVSSQSAQATIQGSYVPGSAPRIVLTPETIALNSTALPEHSSDVIIEVIVTDDIPPYVEEGGVKLRYRKLGSSDPYQAVIMNNEQGDKYSATITVVESPGIQYYVTATDGEQTSTLPSMEPRISPFTIAVLPNDKPVIVHTPVTNAPKDQAIIITADVTDTTNYLESVILNYRRVGEILYSEIPMQNTSGDTYKATIPANVVTANLEYSIIAYDDWGTDSRVDVEVTVGELEYEPGELSVSLTADPSTVEAGQSTTLIWESENAVKCSLFDLNMISLNTSGATEGSISSGPIYRSKTFLIFCENEVGDVGMSSVLVKVTDKDDSDEFTNIYKINTTRLHLREAPSASSESLRIMHKDNWILQRTNKEPEPADDILWWHVETAKYEEIPQQGWVASQYLSLVDDVASLRPVGEIPEYFYDRETIDDPLNEALNMESEEGYCLRFVRKVFNHKGIYHSAYDLYVDVNKQGRLYDGYTWNMPRGALVHFDYTDKEGKRFGHIGIYAGNGQIIHVYGTGTPKADDINDISLTYFGWSYPDVLSAFTVGNEVRCDLNSCRIRGLQSTEAEFDHVNTGDTVTIFQDKKNWFYRDNYHWWRVRYEKNGEEKEGWVAETGVNFKLNSPGEPRIYDLLGRMTGAINGKVLADIPFSSYDADFKQVSVSSIWPQDYQFVVHGIETGSYGAEIERIGGGWETVIVENVKIKAGEIHMYQVDWQALKNEEETTVTLSIDKNGNGTPDKIIEIDNNFSDTLPPITTSTLTATSITADTYIDSVIVTLSAEDNEGGVGVKSTEYSLDGETWIEYTEPVEMAEEGEHTIFYRSTDWFGNREETQGVSFKITTDVEDESMPIYEEPDQETGGSTRGSSGSQVVALTGYGDVWEEEIKKEEIDVEEDEEEEIADERPESTPETVALALRTDTDDIIDTTIDSVQEDPIAEESDSTHEDEDDELQPETTVEEREPEEDIDESTSMMAVAAGAGDGTSGRLLSSIALILLLLSVTAYLSFRYLLPVRK